MTIQIALVLGILTGVVLLLSTDILRIDLTALLTLLALAWSGVLSPAEALAGFSSHAVIAMMAVMIMGRGIAVTGLMERFARAVIRRAGGRRRRIVALLSAAIGGLSGFIQNIGAAALFLPGTLAVARRTRTAPSRLIMPIGFAAILGGTLTMVGSGPLILVNDLLAGAGLHPYGLFSVTPVGAALLAAGILYFLFMGGLVLPRRQEDQPSENAQRKLIEALHIPHHIRHFAIPDNSPLAGLSAEESGAWERYGVNFLWVLRRRTVRYAPCRNTRFTAGQIVALLGQREALRRFAADFSLQPRKPPPMFAGIGEPDRSGFAEVVVPPRSEMVGHTLRDYSLRRRHEVEPVMLVSRGREIRGDFSDHPVVAGDTLVVYGLWEKIARMQALPDFVVATPFRAEGLRPGKTIAALAGFGLALILALAGAPISLAFLTGAAAMVLAGVLDIQEAYQAVEWKVVFLLAGLIPLGTAMQKSGAAEFLATGVMKAVGGTQPILLAVVVALLATLFSLFMSNVGAVVVLAPLVTSMAAMGGQDPRPLVLLAAVCAANSFMLPTHQVNALLMSAGGYRNADYLRAGGGMTLIFLLVVVPLFVWFYL